MAVPASVAVGRRSLMLLPLLAVSSAFTTTTSISTSTTPFCPKGIHASTCARANQKVVASALTSNSPKSTSRTAPGPRRGRIGWSLYASEDNEGAAAPKAKRAKAKAKTAKRAKAPKSPKKAAAPKVEPEPEVVMEAAPEADTSMNMNMNTAEDDAAELAATVDDEMVDYQEVDRLRMLKEDAWYAKYNYYDQTVVDDDGVEVGWDPIFGPSNPIDSRAILSKIDSYMVDVETRDERMLIPMAPTDEQQFNDEINLIPSQKNTLETYKDPYLHVDVPRHAKPWYGSVDMDANPYEEKDWMNNRFTAPEDKSDISDLNPFEARKHAVQLARSKNNEWLPDGYSQHRKTEEVKIFAEQKVLAGSLLKGHVDADRFKDLSQILRKVGGVVEVLSISAEGVYRFHYKGPMKHRKGMTNWVEMMLQEQGTSVGGVRFETGHRKIDARDTVFRGFECYGHVMEQ